MNKHLTSLTLAALLALPVAGFAQEDTTQAPEGETIDLGEPVDTGPQLGDRYSKEKYGDWDLACIKTEGDKDPCSLLQILMDGNGNPISEFSLFRIDDDTPAVAGATIVVPLETLLTAPLTISVDGAPGKRYNYTFCNPVGCVAQIGLTEADVNAFRQGKKATLSLRPAPAPEQVINVDMSLTGFAAGFDVVDQVQQ
ncbi:MAG: invasion associated locus B family protein [Paracoccaceae bacterium]